MHSLTDIDIKKEKQHNFSQFRWYQIGNWIKKEHCKNAMANNYLNFLKQQPNLIPL